MGKEFILLFNSLLKTYRREVSVEIWDKIKALIKDFRLSIVNILQSLPKALSSFATFLQIEFMLKLNENFTLF